MPKAVRPRRYAELMHMTGLAPFVGRLAGRLSSGMKQKLGLACTLVRPPRLLLLDEPTAGVDPVSRRELWAIVDRLVAGEGMSVLLSTAYLDEAERCAEVVLLHEGKVLEQGPPARASGRMAGRTWSVAVPGRRHRDLQMKLAQSPGVVDALVQGEHVRLVTEHTHIPEETAAMPEMQEAAIRPVPPRFEDGFIDMLRGQGAGQFPLHDVAAPSVAPENEPHVIRAADLVRRFGDFRAVDGVSFEVRRGEIFGLLGANGAGKSTTFRMLCGLLPASGGHVEVAGHDLRHSAAAARARLGYLAQKFSQYGNLSVGQNLVFLASAYGLGKREREEQLAWAEDEFDLGRRSARPARVLATHQRARRFGRHRAGDDALHGGSRVLRPARHHGRRPHPRQR